MRDHTLDYDPVAVDAAVQLLVGLGEFSSGWLLSGGGDESESLVAFISESIVWVQELIKVVIPVGKSVMVCPSHGGGDDQGGPVQGADDLVIETSTVVFAAV